MNGAELGVFDTASNLTPEAKKVIKNSDSKISRDAALKISRLPPDQQEKAATLKITQPSPKKQTVMDGEAALTEFKALCHHFISGITALRPYADVFEKVHEIRHEMEKKHEN